MRHHRPKNLGRETLDNTPFGPWREGPKKDVFAHFGGEKSRKSKIFFPQISIFLGPIEGINDIF